MQNPGSTNYIIGLTPEKFIIEAADVNIDGDISVSDAAEIINMILADK